MGGVTVAGGLILISDNETEQDPVGLLGTEAFPCSPFLVGNRLQPPGPSLSSKGQIRTVGHPGREGMQRREEQLRNNSAALGQGPGSTSRDTHNNIFKLFIELKPNKWKMSAFFIPEKTT